MVSRMAPAVARILLVFCTLLTGSAAAQDSELDKILDSLEGGHGIRQVAISPDGRRVAWVDAHRGSEHGIFVCSVASPATSRRRITAGSCEEASDERGIAWSPDSRQLAFLSDAQSTDQLQLYMADVTSGKARKLTDFKGSLGAPSWSPDGKTLAVLFTEDASRVPGPLEPMPLPSGVMGSKTFEQRLTTVDVATGRTRQLSPPDMYVYEYDWSPDGKKFALIASRGAGDANWYVAEIYTL